MSRTLPLAALIAGLLFATTARADAPKFNEVASLSMAIKPSKAVRGQAVEVEFTITPKEGFWTYPLVQPSGSAIANRLRFDKDEKELVYPPVSEVKEPPGAEEKPDGMNVLYYPGPAPRTWRFKIVVSDDARFGKKKVTLGRKSQFQVCNSANCAYTDPDELPTAELEIVDDGRSLKNPA